MEFLAKRGGPQKKEQKYVGVPEKTQKKRGFLNDMHKKKHHRRKENGGVFFTKTRHDGEKEN